MKKLDPSKTMYLKGFDRRGCTASFTKATSNSFSITGNWADLADFAVFMFYDADDIYGHLETSRYLPDFDLSGVTLDFDLDTTNCQNPISYKFASVPWNAISYIRGDDTRGTINTPITSTGGGATASANFTINGTAAQYDRVQLIFLGNYVFDYIFGSSDSLANAAASISNQINAAHASDPLSVPITSTYSSNNLTVSCAHLGRDGNTIQLIELHKNTSTYITPAGATKLIGGSDPSSIHIRIDFTALGIDNVRQLWFTVAPPLPINSDANPNTLVAFSTIDFSWIVSNWTATDPNGVLPLKYAGSESSVISSKSVLTNFVGSWNVEAGNYYHGFAKGSHTSGDSVTINYTAAATHDLYLGTSFYTDRGKFGVVMDNMPLPDLDMYLFNDQPIITRRKIAGGITSGYHSITFTLQAGTGNNGYFDFLHLVVPSPAPAASPVVYSKISCALDFDTDQTYKLPPTRTLWILNQLGFRGDIDLYGGVFFALRRIRYGGHFHTATLTIAGAWNTGSAFGDGDALFINIGGTSFGAAVYPADTNDSLKQRIINAINSLFVGVRASSSGSGILTVTTITPINGFTISISTSSGATGIFVISGDVGAGNEGIWAIDTAQSLPINRGFADYLSDFSSLCVIQGLTFVIAFSQELLAPPYNNDPINCWIQRYADGMGVLTATGFGSWGSGYIEEIIGNSITQTGHGYITGNTVHFPARSYPVSVIDSNHYSVPTGSTIPPLGTNVFIDLQTSQCAFNPNTVTPYIAAVYKEAAQIMSVAGVLEPWLQFGEILHWFFAANGSMAFYDANQKAEATAALSRDLYLFTDPNDSPSVNNYADADFLRDRLGNHVSFISSSVLGSVPTSKLELLWPHDVNYKTAYKNAVYPFFLGGQLNEYINLPRDYLQPGSYIDRIKIEALAWGTSFRTLDKADESINYFFTKGSWPRNLVSYLVPWQNGGCPWENEYLLAASANLNFINFWAMDHIINFSWHVPLPTNKKYAGVY